MKVGIMEPRIIVIDDEIDFLESIRRGLLISGWSSVTLVSDPRTATKIIEESTDYDVALIDYTMPGMSGMTLLAHFADSSPKTACIMISAVEDDDMIQQCLNAGACDYLIKPISKAALIQSISRAVNFPPLLADTPTDDQDADLHKLDGNW